MKKTLLLNSSYEVLSFVPFRKMLKLVSKGKVEIISEFDDIIRWGSGEMKYPAIIRLKKYVKRNYIHSNFSRAALVKRDEAKCQYCQTKLNASQITVDHVLPKSLGGITSFTNCVVCCTTCNNKKANKTIQESGLTLLRKPMHPSFTDYYNVTVPQDYWHNSWDLYL